MTAITARPNLGDMPGMDEIKIGPDGETFGQLKADVRATRAAYTSTGEPHYLDALNVSISRLRAAYARVGLPYRAP